MSLMLNNGKYSVSNKSYAKRSKLNFPNLSLLPQDRCLLE